MQQRRLIACDVVKTDEWLPSSVTS